MTYPNGTRFNRWLLNKENHRGKTSFAIRRWVYYPDGICKLERLPLHKYKSIRDNEGELKQFLIRLNEQTKEERTRTAVEIKHAFISPTMLDDFRSYLLSQIPTKRRARCEYNFVIKYFLNYFINDLQLTDPLQWHKVHQSKWSDYLQSDKVPKAAYTKKTIVDGANKFMKWLHSQRPNEVPPLLFNPLSKATLKAIDARREIDNETLVHQYITDEHWKIIQQNLPDNIRPFIILAYHFGLRRAESLGFKLEDVKNGYLSVERQLESLGDIPVYGPLKGRSMRKVPYWSLSTQDTYNCIKEGLSRLMHYSTLSKCWTEFMISIKFDYTLHDFRHTWITRSVRSNNPRDVQLAAGHVNIETTMSYLKDDRDLSEQIFIPK